MVKNTTSLFALSNYSSNLFNFCCVLTRFGHAVAVNYISHFLTCFGHAVAVNYSSHFLTRFGHAVAVNYSSHFLTCFGHAVAVNYSSHFLTCFGHAGTTVAVSYISHFLTCIAGHTAEQSTTSVNCQNVHALCQYVSMTQINSANNSSFAQLIAFLKLAARANIGFTL